MSSSIIQPQQNLLGMGFFLNIDGVVELLVSRQLVVWLEMKLGSGSLDATAFWGSVWPLMLNYGAFWMAYYYCRNNDMIRSLFSQIISRLLKPFATIVQLDRVHL
ncbi:hypothetical protein Goklo_004138 [Gossypium klotzschianum]|uniref:Uncharacterized protein n=1 Tax=Gossypium klotzschianum TaxID=34286 RepID=A0A7J8VN71_9ROSI|nr:hypothetical protein [Gossypium klotzschianum]